MNVNKVSRAFFISDQWCNCILDGESNHPLQAVFVQKFFKYFTSQCTSTTPRVGRYFFEGVINAHYFGRLVTKLKGIEDIHKSRCNQEEEDEEGVVLLSKMFKAFGLWLEDMRVLDETLHLSSLPPMMMPDLLASVFSPTKRIPLDYLDMSEIECAYTTCSTEWKRLHFRLVKSSLSSSQALARQPRVPPSERILSYDSPRPLPPSPNWQLGRIDLSDTWFVDESSFFSLAIKPQINSLLSYTKEFDDHRREYSSLLHQILDLVSGLYINEDSELWTKGSCLGSNGPKGQKFECAGSAAICHKFCEAKLQSQIELKLNQHRLARTSLLDNVSQPIQMGVILASSLLDSIVEHLMKMYFRHLSLSAHQGPGSASLIHYHRLGIQLFYTLCDCLGEETNSCPMMRHLLTSSLEKLGQAMVAENPQECQPLLERIVTQPQYAHFLTAVFTPGCASIQAFYAMYKTIGQLPDAHASLAFTLLSKMTVESWCQKKPDVKAVSRLLSILGENLKRSGSEVNDAGRLLIHDLHRSHLISLIQHNFPAHYEECLSLLTCLTEANLLDPQVWIDVVNFHIKKEMIMEDSTSLTMMSKLNLKSNPKDLINLAANGRLCSYFCLEEIESGYQLLRDHFAKERRSVGLHGLYSKYRRYVQPLSMLMGLNCCLYIEQRGKKDEHHQDSLFEWIFGLFESWILPLMEGQRQETAAWIRQFAEGKVLFPWAPGDIPHAEIVLSGFTHCLNYVDSFVLENNRPVMASKLLQVYVSSFAKPSIKDFVLQPVHQQWLGLAWDRLFPQTPDLSLIVTVMDTFIPLCHEFLGKIFVQMPWKQVFATYSTEDRRQLAPYLLHIVVKLSAEPQIRQSGRLMKVISQDVPDDIWQFVSPLVFENLMHWYVMSVDAKAVLIQDAHPLDVKILSLLRRASQIDNAVKSSIEDEEAFAKSKVFLRCMIRLLSSCGSKHKNYMTQHELIVEKAIQELVDDVGDVVLSYKDAYAQECIGILQCFLSLVNSNSPLIAKYAVQSIGDCWLRMPDLPLSLVFIRTLLDQAAKIVNSPSMVSDLLEDCLVAFFYDRGDLVTTTVKWSQILPLLKFPGEKDKQDKCLEHAVQRGHCLLLYASLQQTRSQCLSIAEEHSRLLSTLTDWFRHLSLSEENEPKVPLLFREFIVLCKRQLDCGASPTGVIKILMDFCQALGPLHQAGNRDWPAGILGVLGFSSKYRPPARIKVLALSLTLYIQACILPGPRLKRKSSLGESNDGTPLDLDKCKALERELENCRTKQAFYGLADCIDWVLKVSGDHSNSIDDLEEFFCFLVCDNLYSEGYHHLQ